MTDLEMLRDWCEVNWQEGYEACRRIQAELERLLKKNAKPSIEDCLDPWVCCVHGPEEAALEEETTCICHQFIRFREGDCPVHGHVLRAALEEEA